jgi:hypothetical protein
MMMVPDSGVWWWLMKILGSGLVDLELAQLGWMRAGGAGHRR